MPREELLADKQKKLISEALDIVSKRNPDLYYESTETIAHLIHDYFKKEASVKQKEIIGSLSADDIFIKLSHH